MYLYTLQTAIQLFTIAIQEVLGRHDPLKTKTLKGNQVTFMTKELSKSIMDLSRYKNINVKSYHHVKTSWLARKHICTCLNQKVHKATASRIMEKKNLEQADKIIKGLLNVKKAIINCAG